MACSLRVLRPVTTAIHANRAQCFTSIRFHSQQKSAAVEKVDSHEEKRKDYLDYLYQRERAAPVSYRKRIKRPPFAKDLFLGKFDTDIFGYPEIIDKEEMTALTEYGYQIEAYLKEKASTQNVKDLRVSNESVTGLKSLGLSGLNMPLSLGSTDILATEMARVAEYTSMEPSLAAAFRIHQSLGLKSFLRGGTENLKMKYLPRVLSNKSIIAFCLCEENAGSDAVALATEATQASDGSWHLTGTKTWVTNASEADFFVVFAKANVKDHLGKLKQEHTAFFIERDFGGISMKPINKTGLHGCNFSCVSFNNTVIPPENVLGSVGTGLELAQKIIMDSRYLSGSVAIGSLKRIIKWTTEHIIHRQQFGQSLAQYGMIQEKVAHMALATYAIESLSYLVAGILDEVEDPDCTLEAAILELLSLKLLNDAVQDCQQIAGTAGLVDNSIIEQFGRDVNMLQHCTTSPNILRLFIGLTGLQHTGNVIHDEVHKKRNPLFYPFYIMKNIAQGMTTKIKSKKLDVDLYEFLHPSLTYSANLCEQSVLNLKSSTEFLLLLFGAEVSAPKNQVEVKILADMAVDVVTTCAVLSRASRAYCIGLRHAEHEITMASTICADAYIRIQHNKNALEYCMQDSSLTSYQKIAELVYKNKGYCMSHPLERTYY